MHKGSFRLRLPSCCALNMKPILSRARALALRWLRSSAGGHDRTALNAAPMARSKNRINRHDRRGRRTAAQGRFGRPERGELPQSEAWLSYRYLAVVQKALLELPLRTIPIIRRLGGH